MATNPVQRLLTNPDGDPDLDVFLHWCDLKGIRPIPLAPADIARFVLQSQALSVDKIAATFSSISRLYLSRGMADPTAGGPVADAIHRLAPIEPPRSWKQELKDRFKLLPYEVQTYLDGHERQRDKEVRRAHNEAAALRQELAKAKAENPETEKVSRETY